LNGFQITARPSKSSDPSHEKEVQSSGSAGTIFCEQWIACLDLQKVGILAAPDEPVLF